MKWSIILMVLLFAPAITTGQDLCPPGTPCATPQVSQTQQIPAVVRVGCRYRRGQIEVTDWGSGTIISRQGEIAYVLTCWHIFRDGEAKGKPLIRVGRDGFWANLVKVDRDADLALLKIKDPGVEPVDIADGEVEIGETVHSVGFARVGGYRRIAGRVLAVGRVGVTVSGAIRDGVSGGPLLNRQGRLSAVCWGTDEVSRRATCLPRVRGFLGDLLTKPIRHLKPVTPQLCSGCSVLQEQVAALQKAVAALQAKECLPGSIGEAGLTGPPGPQGLSGTDADCQELLLRLSSVEVTANRALVAASKPLYVKKINTVTGEETVEEVHLGEGLIFKMTPHSLLTKREAQ